MTLHASDLDRGRGRPTARDLGGTSPPSRDLERDARLSRRRRWPTRPAGHRSRRSSSRARRSSATRRRTSSDAPTRSRRAVPVAMAVLNSPGRIRVDAVLTEADDISHRLQFRALVLHRGDRVPGGAGGVPPRVDAAQAGRRSSTRRSATTSTARPSSTARCWRTSPDHGRPVRDRARRAGHGDGGVHAARASTSSSRSSGTGSSRPKTTTRARRSREVPARVPSRPRRPSGGRPGVRAPAVRSAAIRARRCSRSSPRRPAGTVEITDDARPLHAPVHGTPPDPARPLRAHGATRAARGPPCSTTARRCGNWRRATCSRATCCSRTSACRGTAASSSTTTTSCACCRSAASVGLPPPRDMDDEIVVRAVVPRRRERHLPRGVPDVPRVRRRPAAPVRTRTRRPAASRVLDDDAGRNTQPGGCRTCGRTRRRSAAAEGLRGREAGGRNRKGREVFARAENTPDPWSGGYATSRCSVSRSIEIFSFSFALVM